jgi:hypothetical protein
VVGGHRGVQRPVQERHVAQRLAQQVHQRR